MNAFTSDALRPRLVVFAKAPQSGLAKTRLIPALGADGAAYLARRMLMHTLEQALQARVGPVELCMSPHADDPAWHGIPIAAAVQRSAQGEGDLGQRMARAVQRATAAPGPGVLLIGTDCPALTPALLLEAAAMLAQHDVVMLPAADGGYVLLGLKAPCPELFDAMPWSTTEVATLSLQCCARLGLRVWQGPTLPDIDEPADLARLPDTWQPPGSERSIMTTHDIVQDYFGRQLQGTTNLKTSACCDLSKMPE